MAKQNKPRKPLLVGIYPVRNLSNMAQGDIDLNDVTFLFGKNDVSTEVLKKHYEHAANYTAKENPKKHALNGNAAANYMVQQDKIVLLGEGDPMLSLINQIKKDHDNPNWIDLNNRKGFSVGLDGSVKEYEVTRGQLKKLRAAVNHRLQGKELTVAPVPQGIPVTLKPAMVLS